MFNNDVILLIFYYINFFGFKFEFIEWMCKFNIC